MSLDMKPLGLYATSRRWCGSCVDGREETPMFQVEFTNAQERDTKKMSEEEEEVLQPVTVM